MVDIFENTQQEAIWHGSASKRLSGDDVVGDLIDEAGSALLAELPDRDAIAKATKKPLPVESLILGYPDQYGLAKSRFIATDSDWDPKISIRHEAINQVKMETSGAAESHTGRSLTLVFSMACGVVRQ